MAGFNSNQLMLLDHYSNGDFRYLGDMDAKAAMKAVRTKCNDLLLPYLLDEMDDIDNITSGISRVRTAGNELIDLAEDMETAYLEKESLEFAY